MIRVVLKPAAPVFAVGGNIYPSLPLPFQAFEDGFVFGWAELVRKSHLMHGVLR